MKDDNETLILEDSNIDKNIAGSGTNNKLQHQQSLQTNKQDLDQAVELDVKPSQLNLQRIDVTINNKIENYSGRIVGSVLREADGQFVANAVILLYFGSGTDFPVYRTISDENGNFAIDDLPPGFYTIVATYNDMQCISRNIKVLPGEKCEQSLSLVQRVNYGHNYNIW
ncbi:MAG TPA: carboxypeptidase regulatory-like domain-containing protein [Clostridiales bacterium]|nr:carboxypeptidase regulatory-like domain-containing protein [Clostridiales bacterium]